VVDEPHDPVHVDGGAADRGLAVGVAGGVGEGVGAAQPAWRRVGELAGGGVGDGEGAATVGGGGHTLGRCAHRQGLALRIDVVGEQARLACRAVGGEGDDAGADVLV